MDLSDPTRALTSTLDAPVLVVLSSAGRPLTVGEVAQQAVRGSEIGVRRCLARLVEQGIVRAVDVGRYRVYELNRDHLAAPVVELLAGLRLELWRRLRVTLAAWEPKPVYACVFGSAARGDGGTDSDIDLFLVHPPFPGEEPAWSGFRLALTIGSSLTDSSSSPLPVAAQASWERQVDDLRGQVQNWTGNPAQVVDISAYEWTKNDPLVAPFIEEIRRDAIVLYGIIPPKLLMR